MLRAFLNFDHAGVPSRIWSSLMQPANHTISLSQTSFNNHCAKCALTVTKFSKRGFMWGVFQMHFGKGVQFSCLLCGILHTSLIYDLQVSVT